MTEIKRQTATGEIVPITADELAVLQEMKGDRTCDGCTVCCKLPEIVVPEHGIAKPEHTWCQHCDPKAGCKIYDRRPEICASFHCGWLLWRNVLPDYWKPSKCGMLVQTSADDPTAVKVLVDRKARGRWRKQPFFRDLIVAAEHLDSLGAGLWLHELGDTGLWLVRPDFVTFCPVDHLFVTVRREPRSPRLYCPMPKDLAWEFDKADPARKWDLWQTYYPARRKLTVRNNGHDDGNSQG